MNIMNSLTLRHLRLNKKRTIVTIIGVIISVAMLTAVPTFITSILSLMQRSAIADTGNWHVQYKGVSKENIGAILNDENTRTAALSRNLGFAILEGSKNVDRPYVFIKAFDDNAFKTYNIKLLEGRLPQKPNEIAISVQISENAGVDYRIGDTISFDIGRRYHEIDGKRVELNQTAGIIRPGEDSAGEEFVAETTQEFTVTGIIERPVFEVFWSPAFTVLTYLDEDQNDSARTDVVVEWKRINKWANRHADELAAKLNLEGINYNNELLRYHGLLNNDILTMLWSLGAIVIALIVTGSVALIYNAFAISISERSRYLGMLASVGATKKQKSQSVLFEGFFVGAIGIPVGIICGTLGMAITFKFVAPLLEGSLNASGLKLILATSPETIVISALISIITIFISAYIPARRASRISPIDAIRQSRDIKLTSKKVRTSRLTRFLFGFEAELGLKNLKRNSRRYKATVFSLVISIVLFLSVSSLSFLTGKSTEVVASDIPFDIRVNVTSSNTEQEKMDFYKAILNLEHVDEAVIEQRMDFYLENGSRFLSDALKKAMEDAGESVEEYGAIYFQVISIDDAALERYAKKIGVELSTLRDIDNPSGILLNVANIKVGKQYNRIDQFNKQPGEKLNLYFYRGDESNKPTSELEIAALAYETPIGETTQNNPLMGTFIVSKEVYAKMKEIIPDDYRTDSSMVINSRNSQKLKESILEYQKQTNIGSVYIYDVKEERSQIDRLYTFVYVFLYGFVALITAICVANIFNTISTSVSLRKREFAMLKSLGMTPEGFNKMINYESIFYGIKALIYGLPLGFAMMYLIFNTMVDTFRIDFQIPWISVATCVIAVFTIVGLTMLYASAKVKKENIIDALKNENI